MSCQPWDSLDSSPCWIIDQTFSVQNQSHQNRNHTNGTRAQSLLNDYSAPSVVTSTYPRHIWGCFSKQSCLMVLEMSPDNCACSCLLQRCLYSWAAPRKDAPRWNSLVSHEHRKKKNTPRGQINIPDCCRWVPQEVLASLLGAKARHSAALPKTDTAGSALPACASSSSSATPHPHFLHNDPSALNRTHFMVT